MDSSHAHHHPLPPGDCPAGDNNPVRAPHALPGEAEDPSPGKFALGPEHKAYLLRLARDVIRSAAGAGAHPVVDEQSLAPELSARRGCFVTLFHHGELHGCIGHIFPHQALYRVVMECAHGAAMRDPRFPAVVASEVDELEIEISVLTEPIPLGGDDPQAWLSSILPGRDGVVMRRGSQNWTFLPQVWEHFPSKEEFLNRLCKKAGSPPDAWRLPGTSLLTYQVECFGEGPA